MGNSVQDWLVPARRSLLPRCPREVWEGVARVSLSLGDVTVGSRFDQAENAWGLGWACAIAQQPSIYREMTRFRNSTRDMDQNWIGTWNWWRMVNAFSFFSKLLISLASRSSQLPFSNT